MVAEWAVEDAEEVAVEERRRAAALALWDCTHSGDGQNVKWFSCQAQGSTSQVAGALPSMSTTTTTTTAAAKYEDADPDEFYRTVVSAARAAVAASSLHAPETLEAAGARILLLEATVATLVKLMSKSYSKKKAAAAPLCE
jgi:hypothetical protein